VVAKTKRWQGVVGEHKSGGGNGRARMGETDRKQGYKLKRSRGNEDKKVVLTPMKGGDTR